LNKPRTTDVAATKVRSIAQVCGAFLKAGSEAYKKKRSKYLQHLLSGARPSFLRRGQNGGADTAK
jgi:hypothetical protein